MMFQVHLVFSLPQPQTQPLFQGSTVPFSGESLENIWALMCSPWIESYCSWSLSGQIQNIHIHTCIFISVSASAYTKNHGFTWVSPTPDKENSVHTSLFLYLTAVNDTFIIYNIFTCSTSVYSKDSFRIPNTSVRNTLLPRVQYLFFLSLALIKILFTKVT